MERDLLSWMRNLKFSIVDNEYHVNWSQITKDIDNVKAELELLNTLIGSPKIKEDFITLATEHPRIIQCIPILLALRQQEIIPAKDEWNHLRYVNFISPSIPPVVDTMEEQIIDATDKVADDDSTKCEINFDLNSDRLKELFAESFDDEFNQVKIDLLGRFMQETGLLDLLVSRKITNLVDYARGVAVGLAAQNRKKVEGNLMQTAVEKHLIDAGFVKDKTYFKNMTIKEMDAKWQVGLDEYHEFVWDQMNYTKIDNVFDFVVKTKNCTYAIATNFYGGFDSGSNSLNLQFMCTARAYLFFARSVRSRIEHGNKNFKFLWIVDGTALFHMYAHYFDDTFYIENTIYNLKELEDCVFKQILV